MTRPILVACSDDLRRWLAEDTLSRNGFEVATARSGLECLELIRESRFAVLVLDLELLWGGAGGVLDYLRRWKGGPPVPVVGLGEPSPLGPTFRYVAKPDSAWELLDSVSEALAAAGKPDDCPFTESDRR